MQYRRVIVDLKGGCKALPRCTVGSRQAEHELQGESMEEGDIVKSRYGNTSYGDEPMREERVTSLRSL